MVFKFIGNETLKINFYLVYTSNSKTLSARFFRKGVYVVFWSMVPIHILYLNLLQVTNNGLRPYYGIFELIKTISL